MKKPLYFLFKLLAVLVVLFLLFLFYASLREYKPAMEISLLDFCEPDTLRLDSAYSVMTWNIGYGGLGEDMDFFYDGGKMVRDTRENVKMNLDAITAHIGGSDTIDFFLLQEVDFSSKRS